MEIKDYAKYVIDNITRATCGNTLNITNKFLNKEYDYKDFIKHLVEYVEEILVSGRISKDKCYSILHIANESLKALNKPSYIETYIIDDFLIDLWRILNEA